MSIAYLNNQFLPLEEARISPMDRGFLFADSIYEVMPIYNGHVFLFEQHIERLYRSLEETRLTLNMDKAQLKANIAHLIEANISHFNQNDLSLYLQVSRGINMVRNHAFSPSGIHTPNTAECPTLFMYCTPLAETQVDLGDRAPGAHAVTLPDERWHRCDIKSTNLLANVMAKQKALDLGADEAILVRNGHLMEGSASNLFVILDGIMITPPKSELILGGITRDAILSLAEENAIPYRETNIPADQLTRVTEVWVSSSTREILPILSIDQHPVGDGKIGPQWKKIASLYKKMKSDCRS